MSSWPKAWSWEVHPTKSQPDPKCDQMSTWPKAWTWQVHLTKVQPDPKLTKCQPDLKPKAWSWVGHLTKGWTSDHVFSMKPKVCQPAQRLNAWIKCDQMSTWTKAWWWAYVWPKVSLNWRSDKNVNLIWSLIYFGSFWLSAKRTSENLNILCNLGLASQRSFLWNQRYVYMYVCVCVWRLNAAGRGW